MIAGFNGDDDDRIGITVCVGVSSIWGGIGGISLLCIEIHAIKVNKTIIK